MGIQRIPNNGGSDLEVFEKLPDESSFFERVRIMYFDFLGFTKGIRWVNRNITVI